MTTRIFMCCAKCGSTNIASDAAARWSVDTQQWELSTTHDFKVCDDCGEEDDVVEHTAVRLWKLANEITYGDKVGWWVVVSHDCEDELSPPLPTEELARLYAKANNWIVDEKTS